VAATRYRPAAEKTQPVLIRDHRTSEQTMNTTTEHFAGTVVVGILAVVLAACGTKSELEPQAPSQQIKQLSPAMYEESGFGPRRDIYGESGFGPRRDIYGESGFGPRR
jgi:hypothetical protein